MKCHRQSVWGPGRPVCAPPLFPKIYAAAPSKRTIPATEGSDINSDLMKLIIVVYGAALLIAVGLIEAIEDALGLSTPSRISAGVKPVKRRAAWGMALLIMESRDAAGIAIRNPSLLPTDSSRTGIFGLESLESTASSQHGERVATESPLKGCPASTRKSLKLPLTYAGECGDFEQLMV
ncbi:hypothetical protein HUJ04_005699 [Dendroctonus ponderosae]|nr:hypothetical protein HUJ04_005699 [Dendroctonus ponderosae]